MLPNTEFRDSIVEMMEYEQSMVSNSTKQVTADRRVRSLAKQNTWQSCSSMLDNKTYVHQEKVYRMDSAKKRAEIAKLNQKIKLTNMQQIYKLKHLSVGRSSQEPQLLSVVNVLANKKEAGAPASPSYLHTSPMEPRIIVPKRNDSDDSQEEFASILSRREYFNHDLECEQPKNVQQNFLPRIGVLKY